MLFRRVCLVEFWHRCSCFTLCFCVRSLNSKYFMSQINMVSGTFLHTQSLKKWRMWWAASQKHLNSHDLFLCVFLRGPLGLIGLMQSFAATPCLSWEVRASLKAPKWSQLTSSRRRKLTLRMKCLKRTDFIITDYSFGKLVSQLCMTHVVFPHYLTHDSLFCGPEVYIHSAECVFKHLGERSSPQLT